MALTLKLYDMKRRYSLQLAEMRFYAYNSDEISDLCFIPRFAFGKRHDFLVRPDFAGIATRLMFHNNISDDGCPRGVRRQVTVTLVDVTMRCEMAERQVRVSMDKSQVMKSVYVDFPMEEVRFDTAHTYKIVARDKAANEFLGEETIHLYSMETFGHPAFWYAASEGGVRTEWDERLYKSVSYMDNEDYRVQFCITPVFIDVRPLILPELELHIHYPDGEKVTAWFAEPKALMPDGVHYTVDAPFYTNEDRHGVYYAELLCMGESVAGFAFTTDGPCVEGTFDGDALEPMAGYTLEGAEKRLAAFQSEEKEDDDERDDFDKLLDEFIASEICASKGIHIKEPQAETAPSDSEDVEEEDAEEPCEDDEEDDEEEASEEKEDASLLLSLDHLTGLRSVKEKLSVYERVVRFNKMRADKNLPVSAMPLHAMFLGSPGTGKTTVAKMMGVMLRRAGMLSRGHVVVRERATLLGQNYSSESENTLAAIEKARGGILLIDEAYQLYQPNDQRDPGKFVIETLLTALADERNRDWMLILAGYPKEMERMFDMNPGLKSRIPESNIYIFDDFTETELVDIAEKYITRKQYTLSEDARVALAERLKADYCQRERNFGNARHVINLIETEVLPAMAVRVTTDGADDELSLTEIKATDIPKPVLKPVAARPRIGF